MEYQESAAKGPREPDDNHVHWIDRAIVMKVHNVIENLRQDSHLHLVCRQHSVTRAFTEGWLLGWAEQRFQTKPNANRDEWRELYELTQKNRIVVSAEWPNPKSETPADQRNIAILDRLLERARRKTAGESEPGPGDDCGEP